MNGNEKKNPKVPHHFKANGILVFLTLKGKLE